METTTTITLDLPSSLVEEARKEGLLTNEEMEKILREKIRIRRVDELFEMADRLAKVDLPPLTEAELDEVIHEDRRNRLEQHACRP